MQLFIDWHADWIYIFKSSKMKIEENTVIHFDRQTDILYWANKWEVSPSQLFAVFLKTKSNNTRIIKQYLRNLGFAL
jgi:hypothetical protein